jgi:predicted nuclease with TOPRIM domain
MIETNHKLIVELSEKINTIISLYEGQKTELEKLQKEHKELKESLELKAEKMNELQNKYENIKISKKISNNEEDDALMKNKVNHLVHEIDKCIGLLNQ